MNKIIILVGASGSGKTTIGKELEKHGIQQLVSFTTREPRYGEVDGVDYHFVDPDKLDHADIIESTVYGGQMYGLHGREVESKLNESDVYFVADRNGAKKIQELYIDEAMVFWIDVSIEMMVERLQHRKEDSDFILNRVLHAIKNKELQYPYFLAGREYYPFVLNASDTVQSNTEWVMRWLDVKK